MNRDEFIKEYRLFLEKEKLTVEDAAVEAGGSLILFGLRETTSDIDMTVKSDVFKRLVTSGLPTKEYEPGKLLVVWNDLIDVHEGWPDEITVVDGVCTATLESTLRLKLKLNRDKDQDDINNIRRMLGLL